MKRAADKFTPGQNVLDGKKKKTVERDGTQEWYGERMGWVQTTDGVYYRHGELKAA